MNLPDEKREELASARCHNCEQPVTEHGALGHASAHCPLSWGDALAPLLAGWRAEAKAEALREAAKEVEERIVHVPDADVDSGGFEVGMDVGCEIAYAEAARRLRERADRIARTPDKSEGR